MQNKVIPIHYHLHKHKERVLKTLDHKLQLLRNLSLHLINLHLDVVALMILMTI